MNLTRPSEPSAFEEKYAAPLRGLKDNLIRETSHKISSDRGCEVEAASQVKADDIANIRAPFANDGAFSYFSLVSSREEEPYDPVTFLESVESSLAAKIKKDNDGSDCGDSSSDENGPDERHDQDEDEEDFDEDDDSGSGSDGDIVADPKINKVKKQAQKHGMRAGEKDMHLREAKRTKIRYREVKGGGCAASGDEDSG